MDAMPMSGGGTTSIVSFLGMWIVMMVPMMAPSLIPTLWRYRQAVRETGETRVARLIALVSAGYFLVWSVLGLAAFPLSVALEGVGPVAIGAVLLIAGAFQLSKWKARQLALCREVPLRGCTSSVDAGAAWQYGLCLGFHCVCSCAGWTATALVLGMMDLRVMVVVTAAITVERLAPVVA